MNLPLYCLAKIWCATFLVHAFHLADEMQGLTRRMHWPPVEKVIVQNVQYQLLDRS
jgi:hypothetical protein